MNFVNKVAELVGRFGEWVGIVGIISMIGVTCADVLGAKLFNLPVPGSTEIVRLIQIMTLSAVIAATYRGRGHVSVDMFITRFPKQWQSIAGAVTSSLGLMLFVLLAWQGFAYGYSLQEAGEVTGTVELPFAPFVYVFAFFMIPVAMMMLCDLVRCCKEATGVWNQKP